LVPHDVTGELWQAQGHRDGRPLLAPVPDARSRGAAPAPAAVREAAVRRGSALHHGLPVAPDRAAPGEGAGLDDHAEPLPESAARYGLAQRLAATECSSTPSTRAAQRAASRVTPPGMALYTTRQRGDHAQRRYRQR